MSEMKSKIPDLKELASMTSKLFSDIKISVGQIIQDYKDIRAQSGVDETGSTEVKPEETKTDSETIKPEEKQK